MPDKDDQCPYIAGLASNNGCPVKDIPSATKDTDGDGINDDVDKCPTVPGLLRYDGCPIPDTDGDGVPDKADMREYVFDNNGNYQPRPAD